MVSWLRQCSSHLSHPEKRTMAARFLGHEVVRTVSMQFESFSPPPRGDWGWLLRKVLDIGVKTLRQLVRCYYKGLENMSDFLVRANHLVRLFLFFHQGEA